MDLLRHRLDLAVRFSKSRSESYHARFLEVQLGLLGKISAQKRYLVATFYIPGELVALFDVPVIHIERMSGFAAANRLLENLDIKRVELGLPSCGCTYQLLFDSLVKDGMIPPPSGFIAASFPCDDAWMYCQTAAARYNAPFYLLDIVQEIHPEKAVAHIRQELKELHDWLGSHFGVAATLDEVVEASNKAMKIKCDIDNLKIQYPGILDSSESFRLFTLYNDLGQNYAVEIFDGLYLAIREKVSRYQPLDCPKLIWLGLLPLYRNSLIREIEDRYTCRVVHEELFDYGNQVISSQDFFGDLAKRIVNSAFFSADRRAHAIIQCIKRLKADGVIHFSQRNCRFLPPMLPILRRKLEAVGIPIVEIQGDVIMANGFDPNRCQEQMDTFFELVHQRRG